MSDGADTVIDIFKTSDVGGTITRDATAIDLNGSRLGVELDAAKLTVLMSLPLVITLMQI
mgnify:CR=1 FL=1